MERVCTEAVQAVGESDGNVDAIQRLDDAVMQQDIHAVLNEDDEMGAGHDCMLFPGECREQALSEIESVDRECSDRLSCGSLLRDRLVRDFQRFEHVSQASS